VVSDVTHDYVISNLAPVKAKLEPELDGHFSKLTASAHAELGDEGIEEVRRESWGCANGLAVRSISPRPVRLVGHCRHLSLTLFGYRGLLKCLIYRKIFARADIVSLRQQCAFSRASSVGHKVRGVDVTGGVLGDPLLWARLAHIIPCLYGYE
jgi:hypothetical protein